MPFVPSARTNPAGLTSQADRLTIQKEKLESNQMTTRMEQVAEDVALTALQKSTEQSGYPPDPAGLKTALRACWPPEGSQSPMLDAMKAAAETAGQGRDGASQEPWADLLEKAWEQAVEDTVQEYFASARRSFKEGEPLQALETLTDAVRATFGHIASRRDWPHATDSDIYSISAGLGSNGQWPATLEELDQALLNPSKEGREMGLAMSASMGRPDMFKFGTYLEEPDAAEREGFLFASTAIELANRLAKGTAP